MLANSSSEIVSESLKEDRMEKKEDKWLKSDLKAEVDSARDEDIGSNRGKFWH